MFLSVNNTFRLYSLKSLVSDTFDLKNIDGYFWLFHYQAEKQYSMFFGHFGITFIFLDINLQR